MRVLHDDNRITVFQYSAPMLDRVEIQGFCTELFQNKLTIYPVVKETDIYCWEGMELEGRMLLKKGMQIGVSDYCCVRITLKKKG